MSRPLTTWGWGICFILPAQSLVPWIQYWWLSACHKLGKAPNSGFSLFFSFLGDGSVSRDGRNSEGLWWLPSPVLEFKRIILDQRKAAEVAFMLGWQLAIAYTEGRKLVYREPSLKSCPDSCPCPWALSLTLCLEVAFRVWSIVLISVHRWQVAALV